MGKCTDVRAFPGSFPALEQVLAGELDPQKFDLILSAVGWIGRDRNRFSMRSLEHIMEHYAEDERPGYLWAIELTERPSAELHLPWTLPDYDAARYQERFNARGRFGDPEAPILQSFCELNYWNELIKLYLCRAFEVRGLNPALAAWAVKGQVELIKTDPELHWNSPELTSLIDNRLSQIEPGELAPLIDAETYHAANVYRSHGFCDLSLEERSAWLDPLLSNLQNCYSIAAQNQLGTLTDRWG